jgi:hypothetical protein
MNLTGTKIYLRRLEPGDLEYLYASENDPAVWGYGDCGAGPCPVVSPDPSVEFDALSVIPGKCRESALYPSPTPKIERFSRDELRRFIENQRHDISETGQIRFVICRHDTLVIPNAPSIETATPSVIPSAPSIETATLSVIPSEPNSFGDEGSTLYPSSGPLGLIGFIDLFDVDPAAQSAGVGILICDPADRRRGYGREALTLTMQYARYTLGLRSLWCTIAPDNAASTALFTSAGWERPRRIVHEPDRGCEYFRVEL